MRHKNYWIVVLGALVHMSCGSFSNSSSPRTASLTTLQQQQILDTAQGTIGSSYGSFNASQPSALTQSALVLAMPAEDLRSSLDCDEGLLNLDIGESTGTLTAVDCQSFEGRFSEPETNLRVDGVVTMRSSSDSQVSFHYDRFSVTRGARSCSLSGVVNASLLSSQNQSSSLSLDVALSSQCNGNTVAETGRVVVGAAARNPARLVANGTLSFTINGQVHDCLLSDFGVADTTCMELAISCRFPLSICNPPQNAAVGSGGQTGNPSGNEDICIEIYDPRHPESTCTP